LPIKKTGLIYAFVDIDKKPFYLGKTIDLNKRKKRITTFETKLKMSKSSKGKINIKKYKLIAPNGNIYITNNGLTKFCEENNLKSSNLIKVLKGERSHHKGWTIERMKDDN